MSHPQAFEEADSIDQVIQSEESLSVPNGHPRPSESHVSINRTAPLPPLSPSSRGGRKVQSKSQTTYGGGRGGSPTRWTENMNSRNPSTAHSEEGSATSRNGTGTTLNSSAPGNNMADFFSAEVFSIVIHNPTTAHRFKRFCQSRACGENMEFLEKIDRYNRLLDELSQTLGAIHSTYTSPDAPRQINLSHAHIKRISTDIKQVTQSTLPSLETIFQDAQDHVEKLLVGDIYPRFVKHQVTASATMALADHRERYQGLGDCFCITDPSKADNPILYASDGFVSVTGYTRKDIIPRNCRFLQGELTDSSATKRLRASIDSCEETVELLLNYRKNGDPFWNLLYVAPLLNERGEVTFFLGGQINCSTTIHSCNDILRVLSVNDDELDQIDEMASMRSKPASIRSRTSGREGTTKIQSSFFKSWRKYNAPPPTSKISVRDEAGMEGELLHRVGKLNFKTQVEAFYTAYSKYLVMTWNPNTHALMIKHYSPGVIDMLCLNLPNGGIAPIYNKDIFKVLAEHSSSSSSSVAKTFKTTVRDALRTGIAVSVEAGFLTGFEERKGTNWFGAPQEGLRRVEERYVTHWTPLKDEEGRVRMVVLTVAPKV
ncbi:hypothetical protein NA56DRAFT_657347 [Hyaloscypha hepaticicola]|uniref:RGS domain-containing protein n=1 Tax=Hyaloscypha hepaticicola TaxID=2082293 RepID=A0A2J6QAI5_9HELO|nr:hypothetical protein NA56DRAFT_657347 [Hyaloscypha hepaticicola]